jgi:hypothetical protein
MIAGEGIPLHKNPHKKEKTPDAVKTEFSADMNELVVTVNYCPAVRHLKETGREVSKWFRYTTEIVMKTLAESCGYTFIMQAYDIETGKAMIVNMESTRKDFSSVTSNQKHFNLPIGCECLENYASDLSLKCFAYDNMSAASIGDLARVYAEYSGATVVPIPELADVVFAVDRTPIDDLRHHEDGQELDPQVVVTPYDKDVITAELIIDPKSIGDAIEPREIGPRIQATEIDHNDPSLGDR